MVTVDVLRALRGAACRVGNPKRAAVLTLTLAAVLPGCSSEDEPGSQGTGGTAATSGSAGNGGVPSGGSSGASGSAGRAGGSGGSGTAGAGNRGGAGGTVSAGAGQGGSSAASAGDAGLGGQAGEGETAGAGGGPSGDPLEDARREYRSWETLSDSPISISIEIAGLCRLPTAAEDAFVASEHGDRLYLLDWLNPEAAEGFEAGGAAPFPVGAAIVKEKLVLMGSDYELSALGLMVKREAGFDPSNGDWEFGYWNENSGMLSGTEENAYCGGCHASSTTDFVFLDDSWRQP